MVRARTLNYLWHEKEKIMNARTTLLVLITLFYLNHTMAQKYETQPYDLVQKYEEAELRYYPPVMKIQSNGDVGSLFRYISGGNETGVKIAMTTPVQMGNTSGDQVMQFVLPSDYTTENTPLAKDNKVQVLESESGHYIAIQYGGYTRSSREKTAAQQLQAIAQKYNLKLTGKPILMVYNSPFQVFNRKNEVLYKVVLQ
jgi:hypothetical protein